MKGVGVGLLMALMIALGSCVSLSTEDETFGGHWMLNEGEGEIVFDVSPSGLHGVVEGAAWSERGLRFDGDDHVLIAISNAPEPSNGITVSLWVVQDEVNQTTWAGLLTLGGHSPDSGFSSRFGWGSDWRFGVGIGGEFVAPNAYYPRIGEWNHLVGTYDGEVVRMYANGELVGEKVARGELGIRDEFTVILGNTEGKDCGLHGVLRDIRVYWRSLTGTEISDLYSSGGS